MNNEIRELLEDLKPLPKGTRIINKFGETKRIMDSTIEAGNRAPNSLSYYLPFWILGWKDLHESLLPPGHESTKLQTTDACEARSVLPLDEDEVKKLRDFQQFGVIDGDFWGQ